MSTTRRIAALAATTALIAGIGVAASLPAHAAHNHKNDTQKGTATLGLAPGYTSSAAKSAGLSFGAKRPGTKTENASTGYTSLNMKVTGTPSDGSIKTTGTMTIKSSITGATIKLKNPLFGYATGAVDGPIEGGITAKIAGLTAPYKNLNGDKETLFDLTDVSVTNTWGKTKSIPGGYIRKMTSTTTANAIVTSDTELLNAVAGTIGTPWFQAGQSVGIVNVTQKVTHSCKTKTECDNLG